MLLYHYFDKIMEIFFNENIGFYTKSYVSLRQINKNKFKKSSKFKIGSTVYKPRLKRIQHKFCKKETKLKKYL